MAKASKKYLIVFMAVLALMSITCMNSFQTARTGDPETLTIGLQSGYPPFEYKDQSGKIVGFDIDVAEQIGVHLKKKIVIKDMEFDGEILSLKQGKIDLIISGMNITPSRKKELLMVPYHGDSSTAFCLIFWEKIPEGIESLEDLEKLSNPTVCVGTGTTAEAYLNQYPKIGSKSFEGSLSCLMDVKYGKSSATLVEADVAEYLQKQHKEVKLLPVPLVKGESLAGFGIGINKNNPILFQKISETIQEMKTTGAMKSLEDKWFGASQ